MKLDGLDNGSRDHNYGQARTQTLAESGLWRRGLVEVIVLYHAFQVRDYLCMNRTPGRLLVAESFVLGCCCARRMILRRAAKDAKQVIARMVADRNQPVPMIFLRHVVALDRRLLAKVVEQYAGHMTAHPRCFWRHAVARDTRLLVMVVDGKFAHMRAPRYRGSHVLVALHARLAALVGVAALAAPGEHRALRCTDHQARSACVWDVA